MWYGSFSSYLPHVYHPLQASLWYPYYWHLKHPSGTDTYCSMPSKQQLIFYFLGSMGLIKYQDVGVGLEWFFVFSNGDSSDVCDSMFSQGCCYLLCCSQGQLPTSDNPFRNVQSFVGICSAFATVEAFHFEDVCDLPPAVHLNKQVFISSFLYVLEGSSYFHNLFLLRKGIIQPGRHLEKLV